MISLNGHDLDQYITKFPDGTVQIWNFPPEFIEDKSNLIRWDFKNNDEFVAVMQLASLINTPITLYVPFLPYGRQDKNVSINASFGLHTFMNILVESGLFSKIVTMDAHSQEFVRYNSMNGVQCVDLFPDAAIANAIREFQPTAICFPDCGARTRYATRFMEYPHIVLDKVREQSTGEITGLCYSFGEQYVNRATIMIVDDLCDGGRTFCEAAKLLHKSAPEGVALYVTHGLFTKGLTPLRDSGICKIFTAKDFF